MMRKVFAAWLVLAALITHVQTAAAQETKSPLITSFNSSLPDNTIGQITPAVLRSVLTNIVNSYQQFPTVNAQSGTSYTIQLADYGKLVTFSNGSPVAVTLPQATASFAQFNVYVRNIGAGDVTITPTVSTIDNAATLVLAQNQSAWIVSDGTDYKTWINASVVTPCSGMPALTGDVTTSAGSCVTTIEPLAVTDAMLAGSITAAKLVGTDIATVGTITTGTWSADTIAVNKGGTGITSGTSGGVLGFTAAGTIASSAALAANGFVVGGGAGATPTAITACTDGQIPVGDTGAPPNCRTLSGDITTVTDAGAVTIANSAISNAKLANSAAYSLKGNFTGSAAAPQDSTIGGLTQKAVPASTDLVLIQDQAASGQLKYAAVGDLTAASGVASIDTKVGAFTTGNGIESTGGNVIQLTAAVRTLPTQQKFTSGSGTYNTPANVQWIRITMVGGGAEGGGSGTGSTGGTSGGNTCWNTSGAACTSAVLQASAGSGGIAGGNNTGSTGGSVTGSTVCNVMQIAGIGGGQATAVTGIQRGGNGGGSAIGGGASGGGTAPQAGSAAAANSGAGGGGGGAASTTAGAGGGGASGGYCVHVITSPAASYTYAVGAGGAGTGAAGTNGAAGGDGGSGIIVVEEFYNS